MNTFTPNDLKLFEQLAKLNQKTLLKVLSNHLKKKYSNVITTKDYIFAEGDIPVALVAHMDTVFNEPPEEIYFDERKGILWSPQGLGGDDRAGIFAILQILKTNLRPHIIFTTDEESGAIGAFELGRLDCPFRNLKYIIQLDRHGSDDCVFYDCDNDDFIEYIESFGFVWNFGTFTDICELCPAWKIAGVNLSVGYYDEHSFIERVNVRQLKSTIEKVKNMLKDADNAQSFEYIPGNWISKDNTLWFDYSKTPIKCDGCKKYFLKEEMYEVTGIYGKKLYFCPDCLAEKAAWCIECEHPFEKCRPEQTDLGTCPNCLEEKKKKEEKDKK